MRNLLPAALMLSSWTLSTAAHADIEPATTSNLTQQDVDAWLDGFMPYAMYQGDIAGAVVVVVKDGEVLTQRGFGYADVGNKVPVDPETTLFRPGSVSKLLTWTAVMQQVEQGKLDLDADVNTYLDFRIPEREGKPVTLRNIMTHTAGFEEQVWNLMADRKEDMLPLEAHLKRWVPHRIFAPGETPAYSNYATALAGHIVSRVSGLPLEDYFDQHLFAPLGMTHSTFRQPLPEALAPLMSKGYALGSGDPKGFEFVSAWPAGSLSASGADMGRFMIAHLQGGQLGDTQILRPETAKLMHDTALTILPKSNRMLLGFYEQNYNGHRSIGHGGDTRWFHSDLHLFPDDGVGLYISMNSAGKDGASGPLRSMLFQQFADRYFPGDTPEGEMDAKTAAEHTQMIVGRYGSSRRADSSFISLMGLLDKTSVVDNGDGTISVTTITRPSGAPLKWREISPFLWREEGGKDLLSAKVVGDRVVRFSFGELSPFMMFDRVSPAKSPGWLMPATALSLAVLVLTVLAWPVSALVRRHYGVRPPIAGRDARAHRFVRLAALLASALTIAWLATFGVLLTDYVLLGRSDGWIRFLQILTPFAYLGGTLVGLWYAWTTIRSGRSRWAKLWSVLVALSFIVVTWLAFAYHFISWGTRF